MMLGVIDGAIIGAVVGVIVSLVMILMRRGRRGKLLKVLKLEGPQAARALLERKIRPVRKVPLSQIIDQCERMAALTVLSDVESLEREVGEHTGTLTAVVQVNAIALLGLALRGPDPAGAARRLDELAARMESEGGRAMRLVKKKVRALALLARAMGGEKIPADVRMTLDSFSGDGGMVQLLVWQALAVALEQSGQPQQAEGLRLKVRALTDAFDPQR